MPTSNIVPLIDDIMPQICTRGDQVCGHEPPILEWAGCGEAMKASARLSLALSALLVGRCVGLGDPKDATGPAQPCGGAPPASSGDPNVDRILDRLEVKGQTIKGLRSSLTYKYVTVEPVEDEQVKEGELLFARTEPNSKFLVVFKKTRAGGVVRDTGEYFLFDGRWLTERNDKAKTIIKREICRPGEKTDPFRIGQGPFPLPFGQKREDLLKNFRIALEDFTLGDPRHSDHLKCIPLPDTELAARYSRVELYVDRALELPVRIVTESARDGNRIEVDFKDVDVNEAPAGSRFSLDEPKDFIVTTEPLPDGPPSSQPGK
jgi:hypothetical protein